MSPERWQEVKEVFDRAVELSPGEREAFLGGVCGDDPELLAEVRSLLAADGEQASVLDEEMFDTFGQLLRRDLAAADGLQVGNYRLLGEIGRGGMAVVYAAERDDGQYRRQVAVKLIKRGMETDLVVARFRRERQILAGLDHPAIARLYDGGVTDDGRPYLVMELVDGEPIDTYCRRHELSVGQRLALFREVCAAVHYAHQNLVVHRDLKPSNVLVTQDGTPKLLDFGIAKLLEPEDGTQVVATAEGVRPMTPEYASPEQFLGRPVTTASDVYSLGVVLYQLLTGHKPYRLGDLTPSEAERAICEEEPERPSTAVGRAAFGEVPPKKLRHALRGDLDNVVLKALEKLPERRYGSVVELDEDLRRYQQGLPVVAKKATPLYRAGKFVRRHRLGVLATALVFLSLVGGIVATLWQMHEAQSQRLVAERVSAFLVDLFEITHPGEAMGETVTAREILDRGARQIVRGLEDRQAVEATLMDAMGLAYFKLGLYDAAAPLLGDALRIREQLGDEEAVAASRDHVADLYRLQGARYDEARTLLEESLEVSLERYGPADPRVADSENKLALVLIAAGQSAAAEEVLRRHFEVQEEALGDHRDFAARLNNLGLVAKARGRLEEAEALFRRALEMNARVSGSEHPTVLVNRKNLAELLRDLGEVEEARTLYEEVLETERRILGADHPALATTLNNLAGCLLDLGDDVAAEELFTRSLELRRAALQPEHPDVAQSLSNLGRLAFERRDWAAAEKLSRQALDLYLEIGGESHPEVPSVLNNLAAALFRTGDVDSAERTYRRLLEVNRQRFDEPHEKLANTLNNLAFVLVWKGDYTSAEGYYREALALHLELLGEGHVQVLSNRQNLAECLLELGRAAEAEALLRQVFEHLDGVGNEKDRKLKEAVAQVALGRALLKQGHAAEAEPVLRQARTTWQSLGERGRRGLAICESVLGGCLLAHGHAAEAAPLLESSYAFLLEAYGAEHPRTRDAERWLEELRRAGSP